jgi:hypothetical protein
VRDVLDRFGVPDRLQHVRRYVWRGGTLRFQHAPAQIYYELEAHWDAPVLEPMGSPERNGIVKAAKPVAEGRWTRGTARYLLQIGIDLAVPSAIFIKASSRLQSFVPFVARRPDQVELAIDADLAAYVNSFLSTCRPVPEAIQADAQRCLALKL